MTTQKRVLASPGTIESYPVLPLRDIVVFPHMIVPLFVGREKSVRALEAVMKDDKQILLVAQNGDGDRRSLRCARIGADHRRDRTRATSAGSRKRAGTSRRDC